MMDFWVLRLGRLMGFWLCLLVVSVTDSRRQYESGCAISSGRERRAWRRCRRERNSLAARMEWLAMEWSQVNRPDELAELARRHLDLRPVPVTPASQITEVLSQHFVPAGMIR